MWIYGQIRNLWQFPPKCEFVTKSRANYWAADLSLSAFYFPIGDIREIHSDICIHGHKTSFTVWNSYFKYFTNFGDIRRAYDIFILHTDSILQSQSLKIIQTILIPHNSYFCIDISNIKLLVILWKFIQTFAYTATKPVSHLDKTFSASIKPTHSWCWQRKTEIYASKHPNNQTSKQLNFIRSKQPKTKVYLETPKQPNFKHPFLRPSV